MSGSILGVLGAANGLASGIAGLAAAISGSPVDSWLAQQQPASWRGVPFAVNSQTIAPGRQTATHVYPYRNNATVWVEDMGLGPRPFTLTGFLVAGDAIFGYPPLGSQITAMIAACEAAGPGTLVHPFLGSRLVSLIGGCEMVERLGSVGAVELRFTFLETTSGPQYAGGTSSTGNSVGTAAGNAATATTGNFASSVGVAVQSGAQVVSSVSQTVGQWTAQANQLVGDATRAAGAITGLVGVVSRYTGSRSTLQPPSATITSLIAASTTSITAVRSAGLAVQNLANAL